MEEVEAEVEEKMIRSIKHVSEGDKRMYVRVASSEVVTIIQPKNEQSLFGSKKAKEKLGFIHTSQFVCSSPGGATVW